MKFILLIILFLSISCQLNAQDLPDDGVLYQAFLNWMDNYGVYYDSNEYASKFAAWKSNVAKINELNSQNKDPSVIFTADDSSVQPASINARNLLENTAVDPVIVESYPSETARFQLNQFSDLTQEEFQLIYTGADTSMAPSIAAASALSTGAIVGIAVGGAVAVGAAAGATAFVIKKKKNNKQVQEKPKEVPMKQTPGVNIYNHENPHHSITARAFYTTNNQ